MSETLRNHPYFSHKTAQKTNMTFWQYCKNSEKVIWKKEKTLCRIYPKVEFFWSAFSCIPSEYRKISSLETFYVMNHCNSVANLKFFRIILFTLMNCFCGMVDRRKAFSLTSSRDHCQRSSPSRISDTPQAGFESAQNLSSGFVEWRCAVVITTTSTLHYYFALVILPQINHMIRSTPTENHT